MLCFALFVAIVGFFLVGAEGGGGGGGGADDIPNILKYLNWYLHAGQKNTMIGYLKYL